MNDKSTPNQMRILLRRMRGEKFEVNEKPKKDLTMRDMLKITRNLNEHVEVVNEEIAVNKKADTDQKDEEEKFMNALRDFEVSVEFEKLQVYDKLVFFGGTVDNMIRFVYTVTPTERTSGVKIDYVDDFVSDNPDNDLIIKKIEEYYKTFYKYWRDSVVQK